MRRRATYHHGDLRKALIDAAAALAAGHGPESVSLRDVAKRAGVSHAAPYHHFAGKAELLHAVAQEGFRRMDEEMRAAMRRRPRAPADRLAALGRAYIRFAAKNTHYFRAMFRGVVPADTPEGADQPGSRNFHTLVATVQDCLSETGAPSPAVMDRALAAWALVHGLASLWVEHCLPGTPYEKKSIDALSRTVTRVTMPVFRRRETRIKKRRRTAK